MFDKICSVAEDLSARNKLMLFERALSASEIDVFKGALCHAHFKVRKNN